MTGPYDGPDEGGRAIQFVLALIVIAVAMAALGGMFALAYVALIGTP